MEHNEEKSYSSSPLLVTWSILLRSLMLWVLFIITFWGIGMLMDAEYNPVITKTLGILAFLISLIWVLTRNIIRVRVTANAVELAKNGTVRHVLPLNETPITSYVHKNHYNFIPISTNRYLRYGRKDYLCDNLSASDFTDLMSVIQRKQLIVEMAAVKDEESNSCAPDEGWSAVQPGHSLVFQIPRNELLQEEKKRIKKIALGLLLVSASIYAAWYIFVYANRVPSPTAVEIEGLPVITAVFIALIFVGVPLIVMLSQLSGYSKSLPAQIQLDPDILLIDNHHFTVGDIDKIIMTPSEYGESRGLSSKRQLHILYQGNRYSYNLGSTIRGKLQYRDYAALCQAMVAFSLEANVQFAYDLM